jgi:phosphoglucomutase
MCGELSFGTAGIRTNMSAGFARLNDLTVIQISHGFAKHLIEETSSKSSKSIVIGYDIRHNSERLILI